MSELRFLDPDEIDLRYASEVRGGETLAHTVERPRRLHHFEGVDDIVLLAAALLRAVNDRHALVDGNKRASMRVTDQFLGLNGFRLEGLPEQLIEIGWTAGRHGYASDMELAGILRPLVVLGAPEAPFDERYPEVIANLAT
jgi:prophage maintenance system killer protein